MMQPQQLLVCLFVLCAVMQKQVFLWACAHTVYRSCSVVCQSNVGAQSLKHILSAMRLMPPLCVLCPGQPSPV